MRLHLIGDDEEVLDVLAELSRHLDYFEISRSDSAPDRALDATDHALVAMQEHARGERLAAELLRAGSPGFVGVVPEEGGSAGARAILAAARLVHFRASSNPS
jgi:hypothetical protein